MCRADFGTVVFTTREWNQLKELCDILEPFREATDLTQGIRKIHSKRKIESLFAFIRKITDLQPNLILLR